MLAFSSYGVTGIGFGSLQDSLIEYVTKADFVEETEKDVAKKKQTEKKKEKEA